MDPSIFSKKKYTWIRLCPHIFFRVYRHLYYLKIIRVYLPNEIFNFDQAYDEVVQISHLPCKRWAPIKLPFV